MDSSPSQQGRTSGLVRPAREAARKRSYKGATGRSTGGLGKERVDAEIVLGASLKAGMWPLWAEWRFHPVRRWRFDYCLPDQKIAIEIDGAVWSGGRHTSGAGFVKDCEKLNMAACMGWRVIRLTPQQLRKGELDQWLKLLAA